MKRLACAVGLAALAALGGACGDSAPPLADAGSFDGDAASLDGDAAPDAADGAASERPATPSGPPNVCVPGAAWFDLPFTVATATYSRARGLFVLRPESEHAIYMLDPDTCATTRIAVPRLPTSIALSPSEADLAVGHDGMVSLIDLASGTVRAMIHVPAPATELAFDAAGRILVFSRALASTATQLLIVDPAAGTVAPAGVLEGGGHLRATADGTSVFWTADDQTTADGTARIVLGRTPLLDASAGGPRSCHGLFPTDDGHRLVTACGSILAVATAGAAQDLAAAGTLAGVEHVEHADTLNAKGLTAVIPAADVSAVPPPDGTVRIHATSDFSLLGELPLPILDTGPEHQTPHGRYVFLRADGGRIYALARRQPGAAPVDGIAVLDPALIGHQPAAAALPVTGSFPHRDGLPGPVFPPRVAATLTFRVTDAAYSRALDRLVMSSTRPTDAVYLVDPATGAATSLPSPANPSTIMVRDDGLVAAITRDGGVTFIDLQQRKILREVEGPAKSVAFGPLPEVLIETDASTASWLNLDTGAVRAASTTAAQGLAFSTVPDTNTFYSMHDRTLVRHDDTVAAGDPTFDLAPFVSVTAIARPCATPFWITDDGSHLVLDCARVFALSSDRARDMQYLGILEWESTTAEIAYAPSTHRFFSVPTVFDLGSSLATGIGRIAVHDDELLNLKSLIDLGAFPRSASLSQPQNVFMGQTPQQIIVVVQSDSFETPSHAVYTFDVTGL